MATRNIPALTSLRGLAALWVALYHFRPALLPIGGASLVGFAARGYVAVDLFFVLSGFVIQLSYGRLLAAPTRDGLRRFALARFARIYPAYLLTTLLYGLNPLAIALFSSAHEAGPRYRLGYFVLTLLLAQNWGFTSALGWNPVAWSISTETVAYMLFPVLCRAVDARPQRSAVLLVALVLSLSALALMYGAMRVASLNDAIPQLGLPRCLAEFVAGTMLCRLYRHWGAPAMAGQVALLSLAAAACLAVFAGFVPDYAGLPAGFAAIVLALTRTEGIVARALGNNLFILLGEVSYSLYLLHFFVKDWVKFVLDRPGVPPALMAPAYLSLALAAACALYVFIERPAQSRIRRWAERGHGAAARAAKPGAA